MTKLGPEILVGDATLCQTVVSFLDRRKLAFETSNEQYSTKFTVQSGTRSAYLHVYNTGTLDVQGKESPLKKLLRDFKTASEAGAVPGQMLPFEIDKFPQTIRERVPQCDPVVISFIEEAITCVRADALLAAAFMLGAASERAVNLLIETYAESIADEKNKDRFQSRVRSKSISVRYDEFQNSYESCKSRPTHQALSRELGVILGNFFHFCRITRNDVGHPQIVPDLDKGVLLANLGQFVTYIERVYGLMTHFRNNGVVL